MAECGKVLILQGVLPPSAVTSCIVNDVGLSRSNELALSHIESSQSMKTKSLLELRKHQSTENEGEERNSTGRKEEGKNSELS